MSGKTEILRDSDVMTFYETLALVMQEKGINAAYVSAKSGISRSYLSKLKSGHIKDVTWEKALLILSAIGISPDEFARRQSGDYVREMNC